MRYSSTIFFFICFLKTFSQSVVIDVVENTLKIGALDEQMFYYGFAQGDQIVFSFQEVDNKELKEVEVIEYPSSSKFMDYKTKSIENKTINVLRTGVYAFRLNNGAISGRICKIKIQRIPASEQTKFFNTSVKWIDKPDTTWNVYTKDVITGHDTTFVQKTKKELVKTMLSEEFIMEKNQTVHSIANSKGNKSSVFFTLPSNYVSDLYTKRVVSWAYWVGVGEESNLAWQQNCQNVTSLVKGAATYFTSPLGGFLAGKITELIIPKTGEDVDYGVVDENNKNLFFQGIEYRGYDFGKGPAGYRKFTNENMLSGAWHIILLNDNEITGIDVSVKVIALVEQNSYEYQPYTEQKITARHENKTFKDPVITYTKIPVIIN